MKRPQPDRNKIVVDTFIAKTGGNRKLKRLWGTTNVTVDGQVTEVLNARRHYYKEASKPSNSEKLFKFLRVFNDVKDYEGKGIKSAWFTLNKSNGPENLDVSASYVVNNLNKMWWDTDAGLMPEDLTLTTTIAIGKSFLGNSDTFLLDMSLTKEQQELYIKSNYEAIWSTNRIEQEGVGVINKGSVFNSELQINEPDEDDLSPDDPWLSILSRYALRSSGIECTIKDIEVGLGDNGEHLYNTAVVTIEIPYQEFVAGDPIVQRILDDLDSSTFPRHESLYGRRSSINFIGSNEQSTQRSAKQVNYYETEDDVDVDTISRSYTQWENATVSSIYDSFWLQDGDIWYFKADVIDNPKAYGTTHVKLNTYLFSLLDTGYKKEKVPFWKKLVAVIVFIVAVVIAFYFPPAAIEAGSVAAAATAVLAGSLVVTLTIVALSAIGSEEWARAFTWISKEVDPLVTIASVILVVTAFVKQGAEAAVKQYAADKVDDFVFEKLLGEFGDLGKLAAQAMSGKISLSTLKSFNRIATVYSTVQLGKLEEISSKNKDLKAEYENLVEETAQESDIMKSYMNIYAKPATADWSIYASTFDLPYERGGGNLSAGNVQKTTKQAIRKADYNEPMFESLNFV
jgi:hypothetical protein